MCIYGRQEVPEVIENIQQDSLHIELQEWKKEDTKIDHVGFLKAFHTVIKLFIPSTIALYIEFGVYIANIIWAGIIGDATVISGLGIGIMV